MRVRVPLATAAVFCCVWSGAAEAKKTTLDARLVTEYSADGTTVVFSVCGDLVGGTSGCFGGGTLGPFEQACAVLEGTAEQVGAVVTRQIYVLDKRTSNTDPITLTVYTRTDTITNDSDTIQVTQTKQVALGGLTGGANSHCSMAANESFVYAGTDVDIRAASMQKKKFHVALVGGFSPPQPLVSITADERGFISLHFGNGFELFDPHGREDGGGGGGVDLVGTRNAWKP